MPQTFSGSAGLELPESDPELLPELPEFEGVDAGLSSLPELDEPEGLESPLLEPEDGFESFLFEPEGFDAGLELFLFELEPELGLGAGFESVLPEAPLAAAACWTVALLGLAAGAVTVSAFGFSRFASMSFLAAARSSSGSFSIAASTAASSVMSTLARLTLTDAPLPSTTKSTASGTSQVVLPSLAVGMEVTFSA